jgi:signal-transduction protein with cAMP-binding, CBS, and nucleotidyltransferase domain
MNINSCLEYPTFQVGRLEAANREPVSVHSNTKLKQAATTMLMNDFHQLPVIDGGSLKGLISWRTIGSRLSRECAGDEVRHFMEKASEISSDESMFKAIESIVQNGYILVRSKGRIAGIVTTHDLATQFRQLIEPYLLLAEIENQIRSILTSKLSLEELKESKDPAGAEREITGIADLSFGEYMRIFQHPERWERIGLPIDRKCFAGKLGEIRNIRNEVMHFDPNPLSNKEILTLRNFRAFLEALTR